MKKILHAIMVLTIGISFQSIASDYEAIYQKINDNSNQLYDFMRNLKEKSEGASLVQFIRSDQFPTENNRIRKIVERSKNQSLTKKQIVNDAQSTKLLIHPKVKTALTSFLNFKRINGTEAEKELYKSMSLDDFVYRLIYNRPLAFANQWDSILLRPPYAMKNGTQHIETIGQIYNVQGDLRGTEFIDKTKDNYDRLIDYLSYDEIPFAALLGLASPTYFINNGNRNNRAMLDSATPHQERGIYAGIVGPRLEKSNYMEWKQIIVTMQQNTEVNGYGRGKNTGLMEIWSKLYGLEFLTYDEVKQDVLNGSKRFCTIELGKQKYEDSYFDIYSYKARISMVLENFLLEANKSAQQSGTQADLFMVGFGLGVWQSHNKQTEWMMERCRKLIEDLDLPNISRINFSYIAYQRPGVPNEYFSPAQGRSAFENLKKNQHIEIVFTTDNPADPLPAGKENNLRFAMYAWDGNAYPGNEYWFGSLIASGDPAAACCSTVAEIQNPLINPFIKEIIKEKLREQNQQEQQILMLQKVAAQQHKEKKVESSAAKQLIQESPAPEQTQQQNISWSDLSQALTEGRPLRHDQINPQPTQWSDLNQALTEEKPLRLNEQRTPESQASSPNGPGLWDQLTSGLYSLASNIASGTSALLSRIWNTIRGLFSR